MENLPSKLRGPGDRQQQSTQRGSAAHYFTAAKRQLCLLMANLHLVHVFISQSVWMITVLPWEASSAFVTKQQAAHSRPACWIFWGLEE